MDALVEDHSNKVAPFHLMANVQKLSRHDLLSLWGLLYTKRKEKNVKNPNHHGKS